MRRAILKCIVRHLPYFWLTDDSKRPDVDNPPSPLFRRRTVLPFFVGAENADYARAFAAAVPFIYTMTDRPDTVHPALWRPVPDGIVCDGKIITSCFKSRPSPTSESNIFSSRSRMEMCRLSLRGGPEGRKDSG